MRRAAPPWAVRIPVRLPRRAHCARVLALWLALAAGAACTPRSDAPPADAPPERLILIVIDTLRRDHLGVYGAPAKTPNIDALAARGQAFTNVVSSFHQTSMSMGSLFTGRTPSLEAGDGRTLSWNGHTWCGLARLAAAPGSDPCIPPSVPTLAEILRDAGWATIGVASNQFLYEPSGFSRGFDEWVEVDDRPPVAGAASRRNLKDARQSRTWRPVNRAVTLALNRRKSDHFFLYVHYIDVHDYNFAKISYAEAVQLMDQGVGSLLEKLEAAGLLSDAVVVLTSDHGERLGELHGFEGELPNTFGHFGNPSFQELLRIPLIIAPARFDHPGRFLRSQDLFGLLLQIAGVERAPASDVDSDELFIGELQYRTYRQGRWKSLLRRADGRHFLYDLEADPLEREDQHAQYPEVIAAHAARIAELSKQLAASSVPQRELSESERERLRTLGYLE
jgi:arylsulfatase A-like enzyme